MSLKNFGRERKNYNNKEMITCPFCGRKNNTSEMEYEKVGSIKVFYCNGCGEEITENLKIK